jgi:predicted NAD/FAD-binding protein
VEFCVTLNATEEIRADQVLYRTSYQHPVYSAVAFSAQRRREELNGVNRTWYCGAYWGYGFHEDGLNSALAVCRRFGRSL